MSVASPNSMQVAIQQLKEIVASTQGEDHETTRLIQQMETVVNEIERKFEPANEPSVVLG